MRRVLNKALVAITVVVLLSGIAHSPTALAEFIQLVSITGGSGQQLSTALATAGYTGRVDVDELTICVPATNTNTMYLGSATGVNASTGFPLAPGDCLTSRAEKEAVHTTSIYIFVASTESAAIWLRSR